METPSRPKHPARETAPLPGQAGDAAQRDDIPAWEPLGDGYWLPHRVRGSNRGRALG
jgi:hypothetical protein